MNDVVKDLREEIGPNGGFEGKSVAELEASNVRDSLTGAYNRGFLEQKIDNLIAEKTEFGAIMLDIDFFKKNINDVHGHPAGDAVLKEFNRILDEYIRQSDGDIVARYGGEEFMIILPHLTDKGAVKQRAEDIRAKVESSRFRIPGAKELQVKTSIGAGVWDSTLSKEDFMESIDYALYQAKRHGRNRVEMAK